MRPFKNKFHVIGMTVLIIALAFQNAHAYIDPGTGSYLFQILIATFIGAFFTIKIYGKKATTYIKNIFFKNFKDNENSSKK